MKTLTNILIPIIAGTFSFNSYCQDTIKTADGYTIKNEEGYIIKDVVKKEKGKEVYEYNNGKLTELTTFSEGMKTRVYNYNEKGQLITETIFDEKGKSKKVINRELEK